MPIRIGDRPAEHLIAAANAEHVTAAPHMGGEIDVPAGITKGGEVGDGGFRAWKDDEVGVAWHRLANAKELQIDAWLQPQRIEIVEIGDARIGQHDDARPANAPA